MAKTGWPEELNFDEIAATRGWLAKRGIVVGEPSRLLSIRVGPRLSRRSPGRIRWLAGAIVVSTLASIAYRSLGDLVDARSAEMPDSVHLYFICACMQVGLWLSSLHRERALGPLPVMDRRSGRPPVLKILGGWYVASFVITFGGGAALATAMYLTTAARTYAWSWMGALGWAGVCCAVILVGTSRRPVHAEDTASAAVDTELRVMDSQAAVPGFYAVLVLLDVLFNHRAPAEFSGWLIAYAVLALGATAAGLWMHHRRPALPPGDYGTPVRSLLPGTQSED